MNPSRLDVLLVGPAKQVIVDGLASAVTVHKLIETSDQEAFLTAVAPQVRAIAVTNVANQIDAAFMSRFKSLEILSTFGVGYDHVDVRWAKNHDIVVTNTPDVLNEEVADTAVSLLLNVVREFPQAERYLRAGKWLQGPYQLSQGTLRDRTIGIVGMGRIGRAIARRIDGFNVPIVYHARNWRRDLRYQFYPRLIEMARVADTLMLIVPGGASTSNLVDKEILEALGPRGVLINMAHGSVVDEMALITALQNKTIMAVGLDVFANEPHVPEELVNMDNVVLYPHLGSRSDYTHRAMDQIVVDNILAWASGNEPLNPIPETSGPLKRKF